MEKEQTLICNKCQIKLEKMNVNFSYLNHSFRTQALRCAQCGQVYLDEKFVRERIKQVELELEDK